VKGILLTGCLMFAWTAVAADTPLTLRVHPRFAPELGAVQVTAIVRPHPDNRVLVIEAECDNYYRSSEMQLDGENARRAHVLTLSNLPSGSCELTAKLRSGHDERGRASGNFMVSGPPADMR
jgi:hypothetical protein